MDDLRRRFGSLDAVAVPDLEAEIDRRAAALANRTAAPVRAGRTMRRQTESLGPRVWGPRFATVPALFAVALLLVGIIAALALGAGWWLRSTVTVPAPSQTSAPSTLPSDEAAPSASTAPRHGVVAYSVCARPDPENPQSCAGSRIWVVNDDGTGARELRPDEPGSQNPIAWSPDGSRLLYTSDSLDGLAMTDAAGSPPEIVPTDSLCPVGARNCRASLSQAEFSPDGGRLAYAVFTAANGERRDGTIAVLDIVTGQVTMLDSSRIDGRLACCDGYYAPSWSADGSQLAFAMPVLTSFVINADGSDLRQLLPAGEGGTAPQWSPDGSLIGSDICGGYPTIYVSRPDGRDLRAFPVNACDFEWTLNGRIVYVTPNYVPDGGDPTTRTWVMDAEGGNVQRLDDTVSALTAAGCRVCPLPVGDGPVNGIGLWQPVPASQP